MKKSVLCILTVLIVLCSCVTSNPEQFETIQLENGFEIKLLDFKESNDLVHVASAELYLGEMAEPNTIQLSGFAVSKKNRTLIGTPSWNEVVLVTLNSDSFMNTKAELSDMYIQDNLLYAGNVFMDIGAEHPPVSFQDVPLVYGSFLIGDGNQEELDYYFGTNSSDPETSVYFQDLALLNGTLTADLIEVVLRNRDDFLVLDFKDNILKNNVWQSAISPKDALLGLNPHQVRFSSLRFLGSAVEGPANLFLPEQFVSEQPKLDHVRYDFSGRLIGRGLVDNDVTLTTYNDFTVDLSSVEFLPDSLVIHGVVYAPVPGMFGRLGNEETRFQLDKDFFLLSPSVPGPVDFRYKGLSCSAASFRIERGGLHVTEISVHIDDTNSILVPGIVFYSDGEVKKNDIYTLDEQICTFRGWDFSIIDAAFNSEGVVFSAFIRMPDVYDSEYVFFNELQLFSIFNSLNVSTDRYVSSLKLSRDSYNLELNGMYWDNGSFFIDELIVFNPPGEGGDVDTYEMVSLEANGDFTKYGEILDIFRQ